MKLFQGALECSQSFSGIVDKTFGHKSKRRKFSEESITTLATPNLTYTLKYS